MRNGPVYLVHFRGALRSANPIMMLWLTYALLLCSSLALAEVIRPGSTLRPPAQLWKSAAGNFTFGFQSAGGGGYFVGVNFAKVNETTLVWTAGSRLRVGSGASLRFESNGNLVLFDGTDIWKSDTANKGVVSAEMRDDGNFVLVNRSSGVVWESFANPTDTLVVTQGFTVGRSLRASSYSFSLQSGGNLRLRWRNNITYWSANASSDPVGVVTLLLNNQGIFTLTNSNGTQYWIARSSDYTDNTITVRRVTLDSDGNLRSYGWHESSQSWQVGWSAVEDQCHVYGWCGDFGLCVYNDTGPHCVCPSLDFTAVDPKDPRQGCRRLDDIASCTNNHSMVKLNHTEFFSYPPELGSDSFSLGIPDCWQNCLKNPSCTASTILSDGSGTCRMKTSNFTCGYSSVTIPSTSHVKVCGQGRSVFLSSPLTTKIEIASKLYVVGIVITVIGTITALGIFETGLWWVCCRKNPKFAALSTQYTLLEYASGAPVQFSYKELQQSTKNFREKVGSGGFGTVYKGVLPNKAVAAVKKLEGIEQGEKQFRMEVATIGSTHHLNLVRLIGFCSEGRHRLLVYEFMKNTSLDTFLFGSAEQSRKLDWEIRFSIALGTARGITYLHEECRECIVHCDIKPENILLDENFNAKVSDFGLAKLINVTDHRNRTLSTVRGTRGYLAPEWLANLPITSKSDVFSYGMVLLELVSGRRNFDISASSGRRKFSSWAFGQYESGNILSIVDEKLDGKFDMDQVETAIQVSFWCIQEQPSLRPSMGKVVHMLEGIFPFQRPPDPKTAGGQRNFSSNTSVTTFSVASTSTPRASSASSGYVCIAPNSEQNMGEILSGGR